MLRARAVSIDVTDRRRRQLGIGERQLHRHLHRLGAGLGDVTAVAVGAETDDFGIDRRAARLRMFELFENQRAGAFAEHQAIAIGVERARRGIGGIVAHAGGEQRIEHRHLGDA